MLDPCRNWSFRLFDIIVNHTEESHSNVSFRPNRSQRLSTTDDPGTSYISNNVSGGVRVRTRRSNNHNPASPSGNVSPANGLSPNSGVRRLQNDSRHQSLPAIVNDSTVSPAVGMNITFFILLSLIFIRLYMSTFFFR